MLEFLWKHITMIVAIVFFVIFLVSLISILKKAKKIEREGLERDAVVSHIEYSQDHEGGSSYYIYVEYRDENDQLREGSAGIFMTAEHEKGEHVKIRFLPGKYDTVRIMEPKK